MGIPHQEAADIFQCVCFILFKKLSTLRNFEKISSWLITTTRRECWRIGAQKRRESTATQSFTSTQAGAANISAEAMAYERRADDEQKQAVRDAVSSLPERCRDLLTMLFYLHEEMSYADIASKMNIPESSIGPTRARCLQKLKTLLRSKVAPGCISDPEAHLY
jgi:RNA polymerase sigma factor (sigma-70 family)